MGQTNAIVPMVGKIVNVKVKPGDEVEKDHEIATYEAMKMEMPILAPVAGKITEVKVEAGQLVKADSVIAIIETE